MGGIDYTCGLVLWGYSFVVVVFLRPQNGLKDYVGQGPFTELTEGVFSHWPGLITLHLRPCLMWVYSLAVVVFLASAPKGLKRCVGQEPFTEYMFFSLCRIYYTCCLVLCGYSLVVVVLSPPKRFKALRWSRAVT